MLPTNSVGLVETKTYSPQEPFHLECGRTLKNVCVAYETYGTLNAERNNAILVIHALTGDAHAAGFHSPGDKKTGWWDSMIGPGKAFDTTHYFVICSNNLGGCMGTTGPGSINPDTGKPYGMDFPPFTMTDIVNLQKKLVDYLGITKLVTVVGGSMGGMQVLEWSIQYPGMLQSAIVIASTAYLGAQALAFDVVGRNAILSDPEWAGGNYYGGEGPTNGLAIARMLGHITYLSMESMNKKFGRLRNKNARPDDQFTNQFEVGSYLSYQGQKFIARFDANYYLYITNAMDNFDLPERYGTLSKAFRNAHNVKFLVTSISSDWLFPSFQSQEIVQALRANDCDVTYFEIQSHYGHDAFLIETETMTKLISAFLWRISGKTTAVAEDKTIEQLPKDLLIRPDYRVIYNKIKKESKVLDLGCGDGRLLRLLMEFKQVRGFGVEINPELVIRCVEMGIPVVQADIDKGLSEYADKTFDYVILNQTLQTTHNPEGVMKQMLRIGRRVIIGFPNFGNWKIRLKMLFNGAMPISAALPDKWYETPNIHLFTMADFSNICSNLGVRILDRYYLKKKKIYKGGIFPNLFSEICIFELEGF